MWKCLEDDELTFYPSFFFLKKYLSIENNYVKRSFSATPTRAWINDLVDGSFEE